MSFSAAFEAGCYEELLASRFLASAHCYLSFGPALPRRAMS
jgi:hypothetical protein